MTGVQTCALPIYLGVGPTAKVGPRDNRVRLYDELVGLDVTLPKDNAKIRSTLEDFLKNKEEDAPQSVKIRNYLNSLPTVEGLQNEAAVVEGSREGVQVPGQPMAGELAGGIEGVDRTGLGGATGDVQQLAGREEIRDRKSTRLNSSHIPLSRMPSSA